LSKLALNLPTFKPMQHPPCQLVRRGTSSVRLAEIEGRLLSHHEDERTPVAADG